MPFVMVYCPFKIEGEIEFEIQTGAGRLVADSSLNAGSFVGHEMIMFEPWRKALNFGGGATVQAM